MRANARKLGLCIRFVKIVKTTQHNLTTQIKRRPELVSRYTSHRYSEIHFGEPFSKRGGLPGSARVTRELQDVESWACGTGNLGAGAHIGPPGGAAGSCYGFPLNRSVIKLPVVKGRLSFNVHAIMEPYFYEM